MTASNKLVKIRRALVSVSDKSNLVSFASNLSQMGIQIISTGGSAKVIEEANIKVTKVEQETGFPEILEGRVKTLHPKIHGAILAKTHSKIHTSEIKNNSIGLIDLVVVNFYQFEESFFKKNNPDYHIELIDIGGPAMVRSAAKNFNRVTVVTDINDYEKIIKEIKESKGIKYQTRLKLAAKAFELIASYDIIISNWLSKIAKVKNSKKINISGNLLTKLPYGENPHQKAEVYITDKSVPSVVNSKQIQGKPLSYNNYNDANAALELVSEFDKPAVAIIKHANPCGVAQSTTLYESWKLALRTDPISAFGGIVALNRILDAKTAKEISKLFIEVIIAPKISTEGLSILKRKKNMRLLVSGNLSSGKKARRNLRQIYGGLLLQDEDNSKIKKENLKVVTKLKPTKQQIIDMYFGFIVAKHVKSNAIVFVKNGATMGIGAGQMSRVDAAKLASLKAAEAAKLNNKDNFTKNSVVASDAFFPFKDGIKTLAKSGAKAIVQPGGSIRDEEVIMEANKNNLCMAFTNTRTFKH